MALASDISTPSALTLVPADVGAPLERLLAYCKRNNWAGFDPYDALNSRLFALTPMSRSRLCRIAFTQILKRSPLNVRPLLLVSREQNPKGLALFLAALVKLDKLGVLQERDLLDSLAERLVTLRSANTSYWCWGYSFPWQTRTTVVPRGAPNLVCTSFVADALLDFYETSGDSRYLDMAASAADYILSDLYWSDGPSVAGFSYPTPGLRTQVHNANLMASALLCRVHSITGNARLLEPALKSARYSARAQAPDGSWNYGELPTQRWIDNFHTGFNLCALQSIGRYAKTPEFGTHIRDGFEFYRTHFFESTGAPKYFHNHTYPIDAHCVAQSIITLLSAGDPTDGSARLAKRVFTWAMAHMWDKRGYFYYRVLPIGTNKVSYMRWSQAWMLLALTTLLEHGHRCDIVETVTGANEGAREATAWPAS